MNSRQREAVHSDINAPRLVLAGAGAGKTVTLLHRVEHIIKVSGCSAKEVLVITFTRNAADELRRRIAASIGSRMGCKNVAFNKRHDRGGRPQVSTIHSFSLRLLREALPSDSLASKITNTFTMCATREQLAIVEEGLLKFSQGQTSIGNFKDLPDRTSQMLMRLQRIRAAGVRNTGGELQKIATHYEEMLQSSNSLDFNDLVRMATNLINEDTLIASNVRQAHRFILVDEFQDMSPAQFALLVALVGERGCISVVGDDDQAIYGFQGSSAEIFNTFEDHFGSKRGTRVKTVFLEENYRSSSVIVEASSALIASNARRKHKKMQANSASGDRIVVCECRTSSCEVSMVADELLRRKNEGRGASWSDFAVLYRTNATGLLFQETFRKRGIPFKVQLYKNIPDVSHVGRANIQSNGNQRYYCNPKFGLVLLDCDRAFSRVAKVLRVPLPEETSLQLLERCKLQRVSLYKAAQWYLSQSGFVGKATSSEDKKQQSKGKGSGSRHRSPVAEVKKIVECVESLRLRVEELPLASFMRRVIDFHPWIKQRMNRFQGKDSKYASSSNSKVGTSGSLDEDDLGSALVREAELFEDDFNFQSDVGDVALGGGFRMYPELKKWKAPSKKVEQQKNGSEDCVKDFDEDCEEEKSKERRIAIAKSYLDHLSISSEDGEQLPLDASEKRELNGIGSESSQQGVKPQGCSKAITSEVFMGSCHQSKGLEWDTVFVVRFNEEEFPLSRPEDCGSLSVADLEEERRLAYVALSRPKRALILSYITQDKMGGASPPPSRFLREIPSSLILRMERQSDISSTTLVSSVRSQSSSSSSLSSSCRSFDLSSLKLPSSCALLSSNSVDSSDDVNSTPPSEQCMIPKISVEMREIISRNRSAALEKRKRNRAEDDRTVNDGTFEFENFTSIQTLGVTDFCEEFSTGKRLLLSECAETDFVVVDHTNLNSTPSALSPCSQNQSDVSREMNSLPPLLVSQKTTSHALSPTLPTKSLIHHQMAHEQIIQADIRKCEGKSTSDGSRRNAAAMAAKQRALAQIICNTNQKSEDFNEGRESESAIVPLEVSSLSRIKGQQTNAASLAARQLALKRTYISASVSSFVSLSNFNGDDNGNKEVRKPVLNAASMASKKMTPKGQQSINGTASPRFVPTPTTMETEASDFLLQGVADLKAGLDTTESSLEGPFHEQLSQLPLEERMIDFTNFNMPHFAGMMSPFMTEMQDDDTHDQSQQPAFTSSMAVAPREPWLCDCGVWAESNDESCYICGCSR